jgi:energy-coupling factor transporter ATP-binding protein EcfA2
MKIQKIAVKEYGPLVNISITPGVFECIFGLNESGKTALIEALSHVLFKRNVQTLRYGKPKQIEIILEENDSKHTLPSRTKKVDLPQGDVSHLLYVEASQSTMYSAKGEKSFWDSIKSLLSRISKGIRISEVEEKIFDSVGLTKRRGEWKDDKSELIERTRARKELLSTYLDKIDEYEIKQTALAMLSERVEELKQRKKTIEQHRNYQEYRELTALYRDYQDKKNELQNYERYKYEYLERWQELEAQKKSRKEDENRLTELDQEIADIEQDMKEITHKEQIFEKEDFKSCIMKAETEIKQPSLVIPIIITMSSIIIVILSFFTRIPLLPAFIILGISCVILAITLYRRHIVGTMETEYNRLLKKAQHHFPDISTLAELAAMIERTQTEKIAKQTALEEKRITKHHLARLRDAERISTSLADLRNKTGLAEISDLKNKLHTRRRLEQDLSGLGVKINGLLSQKDESTWKRLIDERKTEEPAHTPDISEEKDIIREISDLQERITVLKTDIAVFKETLKEKCSIADDRMAFIEYSSLEEKLADYELEKKAAHAIRRILNELSSELDATIEHILQGDNSLSEYFAQVTDRYTEVAVKNRDFVVKDREGHQYEIDHLSSGAQDQLRLCFRLAALSKLYPHGCFLLLDDAFIFADWQRRARLTMLLKMFADEGNQVIYLTSDDHTRDLLAAHGARVTTL